MESNIRKDKRIFQILTGLFILTSTLSILISFLLNFEFTSPAVTFEEDLFFLSDNASLQKTSSVSWLITGIFFLLLLPVYLISFSRYNLIFNVLNGFFILVAGYAFFRAGMIGLFLTRSVESLSRSDIIPNANVLLSLIKETMLYIHLGVTAFGSYLMFLSFRRIREMRFHLAGGIPLMLSGPVIILFIWMDPEHLLLTTAMALGSIGLMITGVRMFNNGLEGRFYRKETVDMP